MDQPAVVEALRTFALSDSRYRQAELLDVHRKTPHGPLLVAAVVDLHAAADVLRAASGELLAGRRQAELAGVAPPPPPGPPRSTAVVAGCLVDAGRRPEEEGAPPPPIPGQRALNARLQHLEARLVQLEPRVADHRLGRKVAKAVRQRRLDGGVTVQGLSKATRLSRQRREEDAAAAEGAAAVRAAAEGAGVVAPKAQAAAAARSAPHHRLYNSETKVSRASGAAAARTGRAAAKVEAASARRAADLEAAEAMQRRTTAGLRKSAQARVKGMAAAAAAAAADGGDDGVWRPWLETAGAAAAASGPAGGGRLEWKNQLQGGPERAAASAGRRADRVRSPSLSPSPSVSAVSPCAGRSARPT